MALSFLKDRDENAVVGNLGAFTGGGVRGNSIQTALEIYRKDQKTHHEQSIASDLTRGLLRKVFRDTVLESSKQVKRKYSYSAVGSTVQEDIDAANMGIMAKLKKLQKERLIVARLGFPDKAMEIDEHIEKIRADLRSEREKVDSKILEDALAALAIQHNERLSALELQLKADENKVKSAFDRERAVLLQKQEKQFVRLVDDAIKRAIGKSKSCSCEKKYLCHHNKTASFNTRRPKKEVIHFRKNAKRLRHGGRLDESAAWEEKAAELDADHLDRWREEVAASLTASAWGGSSSALDQLASQHQREITRMETAQANEWTLMLLRHRTARRNSHNAIMVEQKKLRNACKKNAEERHRREMVGDPDPADGTEALPGDPDEEDISGMLRDAIDRENSADEAQELAGRADFDAGGAAAKRPPVRPASAPPARGRRPQPSNTNCSQQASVSGPIAQTGGVRGGDGGSGVAAEVGRMEDDNSFGKDSHDLRGFDELEGEMAATFSYEDYPAAGSPDEPEWTHVPWCGTNSGEIPILDKNEIVDGPEGIQGESQVSVCLPVASPSPGGHHVDVDLVETAVGVGEEQQHAGEIVSPLSSAAGGEEGQCGGGDLYGNGTPPRASRGAPSPRTVAGGRELKRYDWGGADAVPTKPSLFGESRIPTGNRADKQRYRNARRKDTNRKTVSWGENLEVPPDSDCDDDDDDNDNGSIDEGEGGKSVLDDIVDGFVDDDFLDVDDENSDENTHRHPTSAIDARQEHCPLDNTMESRASTGGVAAVSSATSDTDKSWTLAAKEEAELDTADGIYSDDDDGSVVRVAIDDMRDVGVKTTGTVVGAVPALKRVEGSPTEEALPPHEESESEQTIDRQEHPLQHALDQFCLIGTLHGDWLCLLRQIVGHVACRTALSRWSRPHPWAADVEEYLSSGLATHGDRRESLWGSARAGGVTAAIACSSTLAPFVASSLARHVLRNCKDGRKALGGRTCDQEPALARSKRPWRTLFERILGSMQYGAILCAADKVSSRKPLDNGRKVISTRQQSPLHAQTKSTEGAVAAAAGKVVWANEGFEKLAGVEAVDVVGQDIGALFEESGAGEEGFGELTRSLELGTSCMLWMTMAGQQGDEVTDVLCLHRPVEVPPRLSAEGRYSALLFFDSASVSVDSKAREAGAAEGGETREGEIESHAMPPEGVVVFDPGGKDQDRECSRRQACRDLARAMAILLADHEGRGNVPAGCTTIEANTSGIPESAAATDDIAPISADRERGLEIRNGYEEIDGQQDDPRFQGIPCEKRHSLMTSRLPPTSPPPWQHPPVPCLHSSEVSGDSDRGGLFSKRGFVGEELCGGDGPGDVSFPEFTRRSDDDSRNGDEGGHERTGQGRKPQPQQQPRPCSLVSKALAISTAAECLSSDDSSVEPRDDLLLSPDSADASALAAKASTDAMTLSDAGDRQASRRSSGSDVDYGGRTINGRSNVEDDQRLTAKGDPPSAGNFVARMENTTFTNDGGETVAVGLHQDESDDPYEDDFCCDEEEDSLSMSVALGQADGATASKSSDITNNGPHSNTGRSGMFVGAGDGTANDHGNDAFALSSSGGTYSRTVEDEVRDDNDHVSWRGSSEEGLREGAEWRVYSPPQLKSGDAFHRDKMPSGGRHHADTSVTDIATKGSGVDSAANWRE